MAKVGLGKSTRKTTKKKARQGNGTFTKWCANKRSKLYRKKYRSQGR